jgi:hypothetical protein
LTIRVLAATRYIYMWQICATIEYAHVGVMR